ncbi:hypothetical protein AOE01nite_24170 [Acetobacter oeni]|uniref:Uncharacterized protein n=1 Tax=Acetobacter oeni TaxID=304077 RepID=A0A511XMM2_9PROT|nr:hypothetical protein AA21952_1421 [Acetobacter oeni LMG 21952]GEN64193.1 hypothetical protein AOE01nite_24170 [Acetobacter oeni]
MRRQKTSEICSGGGEENDAGEAGDHQDGGGEGLAPVEAPVQGAVGVRLAGEGSVVKVDVEMRPVDMRDLDVWKVKMWEMEVRDMNMSLLYPGLRRIFLL